MGYNNSHNNGLEQLSQQWARTIVTTMSYNNGYNNGSQQYGREEGTWFRDKKEAQKKFPTLYIKI